VLTILDRLRAITGPSWVRTDEAARSEYGQDALKQIHEPDAVVFPADTREVSLVAALCNETRTPLVPRGAGTGYSGGAVPVAGGIVIALTRLDRILEIDERSLLAVVQPGVITGVLQQAVEARGLFYPPDPASLDRSAIGGNVAECAGGPRAFKYGTTRRFVLGLEAVLPDGAIVRTGSRTVKNVVGYDLTQLLVGSEGTLAIITEIVLRLLPKPARRATLRAGFPSVDLAAEAAWRIMKTGVMPSALELVDEACLDAVRSYLETPLAPPGASAVLLIEVDGGEASVAEDLAAIATACEAAGASEIRRAMEDSEAAELWRLRRELSPALRTIAALKLNHDVVVPLGRIADLFGFIDDLRRRHDVRIACFGHAGDGNIHVNIMVDPDDSLEVSRAREVERLLFEGVVARQGSISGEHGIGYTKARYLGLELSGPTIELMKRVKDTFDPNGILNPGKIFPR
jgi:glycolate oxidase